MENSLIFIIIKIFFGIPIIIGSKLDMDINPLDFSILWVLTVWTLIGVVISLSFSIAFRSIVFIVHLIQKFKMRNNRGFSLIELVIAMSFLAIIVLGAVSLQNSNLAMLSGRNNELQAHFLANQGVQIVKAIGYDTDLWEKCNVMTCRKKIECERAGTKICKLADPKSPGDYEPVKQENMTFARTVDINSKGLFEAYDAAVTVEWTDSSGNHSAEAKYLIFQSS